MAREVTTLAILFSDIAKSTHLYETLGDLVAKSLIGSCLSLFSDITEKFSGTVIKTIGDEQMCAFPSAKDAIEAGISMQRELEKMPLDDPCVSTRPDIYIGIQYGDVIREKGDVFGDAVNVAARMVSMAKLRQIITTEETIAALPEEDRPEIRIIDRTAIRDKKRGVDIYEVLWEEQSATDMPDDPEQGLTLRTLLELRFGNRTIEIDSKRPTATLGRQSNNDLVIADSRISRSHARIEYREGEFVLIDLSSNGTFVTIQGNKTVNCKRNEIPLLGSGIIGLGREIPPDSPEAIYYSIKM